MKIEVVTPPKPPEAVRWYCLEMFYAVVVTEVHADPSWKVVALTHDYESAKVLAQRYPHAEPKHVGILNLVDGLVSMPSPAY